MPQRKRARARPKVRPKSKKTKVPTNQFQKFQVFPKLPQELRDMIWKEGILPQVISIHNDSLEYKKDTYLDYSSYYKTVVRAKAIFKTPAILHACHDSRAIGLNAWSLELRPQLGHPVYFNWKRDTLFMDNFDALLAFYGGPWAEFSYFGNDMTNIERSLRHLVLGEEIPKNDWVATKIISRLYNLEDLTLPRPVGRGFAADKIQGELTQKIRAWMKEKQDLYSEQHDIYKDWVLPDIEFITKKELEDFDDMAKKNLMCQVKLVSADQLDETKNKSDDEEWSVAPLRDAMSLTSQRRFNPRRQGRRQVWNGLNRFGRPAMWSMVRQI